MTQAVSANTASSLPRGRPLVAWIGDDFTGAAATMEVLAFAGLKSVLFLAEPTDAQLAQFKDVSGLGIATMARTKSPEWMDEHLPRMFRKLAESGAELVHYKVCSTLDSSVSTGSIGRALNLGVKAFAPRSVPIIVAAPEMRRYQAFGNLFAGTVQGVFRLDRHPVMSRHPVTPMAEADVARHIGTQTELAVDCLDIEALADIRDAAARLAAADGAAAFTLDQIGPAEEAAAGALLWQGRTLNRFVIGSQGVQYALVRHWLHEGLVEPPQLVGSIGRVEKMAVVSGSVSPVTADQIAWSTKDGFTSVGFDALAACGSSGDLAAAEEAALDKALNVLDTGSLPLIHSAAGPDDPGVKRLEAKLAGRDASDVNARIGQALGRILRRLIESRHLRRVVVSGGDTSGHVCTELGIYALSALAPTIPGAPICRAHADGPMDGLQLALKGGQMGSTDYFNWVRDGGGARAT